MRSSKSRSRGNKNRNRSGGNTGGNNVNRVFDSSGPEGKVRGTPQQIIDKYQQLTNDSQLSNDRVAAENFQQHAEHYLRLLSVAQREADAKRAEQEAKQRDRHHQRDNDRQEQQPAGDLASAPQPEAPRQADAPKPDAAVIDTGSGTDSGLVETPESAPKPKRQRKPRAPRTQETDQTTDGSDAPKAAE